MMPSKAKKKTAKRKSGSKYNAFAACEKCDLSVKAKKEIARHKRLLVVLAHELLRHDEYPVSIGKRDLKDDISDIDIARIGAVCLEASSKRKAKKNG